MVAYPISLEDDDGTVLVTSPDFPELTTFGEDRDEVVARAVLALEEAIAARIHDRKDSPTPSQGKTYAVLPTLTSVKVLLYQGMRDQGVGKAELARRLGWHLPQVDRVLDVQHRSRLDQMDAALRSIGRRLHVTAAVTPNSAPPAGCQRGWQLELGTLHQHGGSRLTVDGTIFEAGMVFSTTATSPRGGYTGAFRKELGNRTCRVFTPFHIASVSRRIDTGPTRLAFPRVSKQYWGDRTTRT